MLKRLQKEVKSITSDPPYGITLLDASNIHQWLVDIEGPPNSCYENQHFRLQLEFPSSYPLEAPLVIFKDVPVHEHIYSNGHVCLSILYEHWSPALTVQAVCLSLQSMLGSAKEKKKPSDDHSYVKRAGNPKDSQWVFHDDNI